MVPVLLITANVGSVFENVSKCVCGLRIKLRHGEVCDTRQRYVITYPVRFAGRVNGLLSAVVSSLSIILHKIRSALIYCKESPLSYQFFYERQPFKRRRMYSISLRIQLHFVFFLRVVYKRRLLRLFPCQQLATTFTL